MLATVFQNTIFDNHSEQHRTTNRLLQYIIDENMYITPGLFELCFQYAIVRYRELLALLFSTPVVGKPADSTHFFHDVTMEIVQMRLSVFNITLMYCLLYSFF